MCAGQAVNLSFYSLRSKLLNVWRWRRDRGLKLTSGLEPSSSFVLKTEKFSKADEKRIQLFSQKNLHDKWCGVMWCDADIDPSAQKIRGLCVKALV